MTRDEAIAYINAHPAMFKGASQEEVLSKTQSASDANYYNPTMFVPEQGKTVVKQAAKPAAKSVASKAAPAVPVTNSLTAKLKGSNALPWVLGLLTLSLGAGMAIYKVSR